MDSIQEEVMTELRIRLAYIQRGGRVQRMHMVPTLHPQNVAAHSFGVAWWCWLLSHEKPSANLLMAALEHDLPEGFTGDIPTPTKHAMNMHEALAVFEAGVSVKNRIPVFELTESEATVLKLADNFELLQHCIRERKLGNKTDELEEMWGNVINYVALSIQTQLHKQVMLMLHEQWRSA